MSRPSGALFCRESIGGGGEVLSSVNVKGAEESSMSLMIEVDYGEVVRRKARLFDATKRKRDLGWLKSWKDVSR